MVPAPEPPQRRQQLWCTRPSSTWAAPTPERTARRQASILGSIPPAQRGQQPFQLTGGQLPYHLDGFGPVGIQPPARP
ncbi:hypothetical protein GCM10020229_23390 [Kitasatospora albolonga]